MAGGLAAVAATSPTIRTYAASPGTGIRTLGVLWGDGPEDMVKSAGFNSFKAELARRGYVEGRNLSIESRFAQGRYEQLPALAAGLVEKRVDVLVTFGTPVARAAHGATSRIPIVAVNVTTPVKHGLAGSLVRPGKNVTGITNSSADTLAKRLQMLARLAPGARRVGWIVNPDNPVHRDSPIEARGAEASIEVARIPIRKAEDVERELEAFKGRIDALAVGQDAVLTAFLRQFASFALTQRLPSLAQQRSFVELGGLCSYGQNPVEQWRAASEYVPKILEGADPGELPFLEASKFELCLNGKTANAIGVKIPQDMLLSAEMIST